MVGIDERRVLVLYDNSISRAQIHTHHEETEKSRSVLARFYLLWVRDTDFLHKKHYGHNDKQYGLA